MAQARKRAAIAVILAVALGAGLTACQTGSETAESARVDNIVLPPLSEVQPVADPTAYVGPTTSVIGGPTIQPLQDAPEAKLPVTVQSHDASGNKSVEVTDNSRVLALSLNGSLGELVYTYGLGDSLVGRDIATNFPGSEDLPVITRDGHSIDGEAVLSLNPSLIITDGTIGPVDVVLQMRDAGVPVVTVDRAFDAESSYETMQQVADALGIAQVAPPLIDELKLAVSEKEAELQHLIPTDSAKVPRVAFLYVRGTAGVFYLFGEGSGADSLIRSIGAVDVAEEIGWNGMKPMTEEALIAMNPDVILVMSEGLESAGGVDGLLAAQPSVALTPAGQHKRIIDVDDKIIFAGGTRTPDVIDGLARAVYAPDSLK